MKKMIITGASGYIGRHVVSQAVKEGFDVTSIVLPQEKVRHAQHNECHLDLFTASDSTIKEIFSTADLCIHLAWEAGFNHHADCHLQNMYKHYQFIEKIIDCGVKNISIMGTMHEIGYHVGPIDEKTACNPLNPYGIAKNFLRQASLYLAEKKGVSLKWLRLYYILGDDLYNNSIFAKILLAAKEGKDTFPLNSGEMLYDFIDMKELCEQIVTASVQTKYSGIINCCSGVPKSLRSIVEKFIVDNKLDIRPIYDVYPSRPYDSPAVWGDNKIIKMIMENK